MTHKHTTEDEYGREVTVIDQYKYTLKNTGDSSQKYGPCEICGKHCSEVFLQTEQFEYKPNRYTSHKCYDRFGHRDCLESMRYPLRRIRSIGEH